MRQAVPYRNPLVRDLHWALASPPLLQRSDAGVRWLEEDWFAEISSAYRHQLARLEHDPRSLAELVASQTDRRLGNYFEMLWRFWLADNTRYQLLHANLAVRSQQRTIGEFDFLVRDLETGRTLHWEIAVKFYLGCDNTTEPRNWWGPARRDRLDIKTDRMLKHQGRLSEHPAARQLLQQLGLRVDETWLIVKGRLFYPGLRRAAAPRGAHPGHLRGFWIEQDALSSLTASTWLELDRHQWLAPLVEADTGAAVDVATLASTWQSRPMQRPLCVARIANGTELERGFIVPTGWSQPDRHGP